MTPPNVLVAAIYLNSRGFGFVVLEGPNLPRDWSVIEARGGDKRERIEHRVGSLINRYRPDIVVLQNTSRTGTHRSHHIRRLNVVIARRVGQYGVPIEFISRDEVRQQFGSLGATTKDAIAAVIARQIPAIERLLPLPRKPWKSEDAKMGIFDAAALALTFYNKRSQSGSESQNDHRV